MACRMRSRPTPKYIGISGIYPVPRAGAVEAKPPPKLEVPLKLGSQDEAPPGVGRTKTKISSGRYARHTHRSQQTVHENRPGRTARETCIRKPTSCDTCFAEAVVRDEVHSARRFCSLRRLWNGNGTVGASVSMIQPNTYSCVSQSVISLADRRGGSETPRSPNKRKWSDASDWTARKQRRPSGHHCNSTTMLSST